MDPRRKGRYGWDDLRNLKRVLQRPQIRAGVVKLEFPNENDLVLGSTSNILGESQSSEEIGTI
jgi:hypothetical protein